MSNIKVGDKVKVVANDFKLKAVQVGGVYGVVRIIEDSDACFIQTSEGTAYMVLLEVELVVEPILEYKVGDRVKFIGNSNSAFTKGRTYIVSEYPNRYGHVGVTLDDDGSSTNGMHKDNWELVEEVQEPKPLIKREVAFYYGEEVALVCHLRNGLEVYETKQGELVVYNSKTGEVEGEIPL